MNSHSSGDRRTESGGEVGIKLSLYRLFEVSLMCESIPVIGIPPWAKPGYLNLMSPGGRTFGSYGNSVPAPRYL